MRSLNWIWTQDPIILGANSNFFTASFLFEIVFYLKIAKINWILDSDWKRKPKGNKNFVSTKVVWNDFFVKFKSSMNTIFLLKKVCFSTCSSSIKTVWLMLNGMLNHSFGGAVIFISLQHFNAPSLDLMPCLPSRLRREAINSQCVSFIWEKQYKRSQSTI